MQVDSSINSLLNLEKKLEESTKKLAKLTSNDGNTSTKYKQTQTNQDSSDNANSKESDLTKEMVEQIQIPIAYSVNAKGISVQNAIAQTIIDIKV